MTEVSYKGFVIGHWDDAGRYARRPAISIRKDGPRGSVAVYEDRYEFLSEWISEPPRFTAADLVDKALAQIEQKIVDMVSPPGMTYEERFGRS